MNKYFRVYNNSAFLNRLLEFPVLLFGLDGVLETTLLHKKPRQTILTDMF